MLRKIMFWIAALCLSAAAETGDTLVVRVRDLLGQLDSTSGASTFSNADIRRMLSTSVSGVVGEAMASEADTVIRGGAESNAPPSNFLGFSGPGILMRNNEFVSVIPVISADSLYRMGSRPTEDNMGFDNYVMVWMGNRIWILPALNSNDSVKVSFYSRPSDIISSAECSLSAEWEYVIIYNAAAMGYARLEDWAGYDRMMAERDKKLDALRTIGTLKQKTSPAGIP